MDGFGRKLLDQFYKVGSSLEVMCHVDRLPKRPLPEIIEWRHGEHILSKSNTTLGQRYILVDLRMKLFAPLIQDLILIHITSQYILAK